MRSVRMGIPILTLMPTFSQSQCVGRNRPDSCVQPGTLSSPSRFTTERFVRVKFFKMSIYARSGHLGHPETVSGAQKLIESGLSPARTAK